MLSFLLLARTFREAQYRAPLNECERACFAFLSNVLVMHLIVVKRIFSCYYFIPEVEVPIRRDSLDGPKKELLQQQQKGK